MPVGGRGLRFQEAARSSLSSRASTALRGLHVTQGDFAPVIVAAAVFLSAFRSRRRKFYLFKVFDNIAKYKLIKPLKSFSFI